MHHSAGSELLVRHGARSGGPRSEGPRSEGPRTGSRVHAPCAQEALNWEGEPPR